MIVESIKQAILQLDAGSFQNLCNSYLYKKALCEDVGIRLNILGIDIIAEDLYLFYHGIARDYLGISISTGQIQTYDDFVKSYNSSKIAAPINTKFLFRDEEIQKIDEAYQNVNVVILAGAAGTGKTRLALHYAKQDSDINNQKLYCISSKALPIYEDLRRFIDKPGNYFLFIDDANELSGLEHIIRYTTLEPEGYNVRVLISVRDYALKK